MKIGYISDSVINTKTGIGLFAFKFLEELSKKKVDLYLIDRKKRGDLQKYSHKQNVLSDNFPVLRRLLWHFVLLKRLEKQKINLDIIFNPSFFPNVMGNHKNLILMVYDFAMFRHPETVKVGKKFYFKHFLPIALRKTKKIVTDSLSAKKDLVELFGISASKVRTVYGAAATEFQIIKNKSALEKVSKKYHLPKKFYLFLGTIEPRKNVSRLFQAFDKVYSRTKCQLVMVGKKGWKNKKIAEAYRKTRHRNKIIFTGYVASEDLPAIYNLAEAFVFPSLYEGFGLPLLEAMRCGCPVVASQTSSIPEVCGNAGIYIDPENTETISRAMLDVVQKKKLRKSLIKEGLKQAKKFDWEKSTAKLLKIFKSCHSTIEVNLSP